MGDIIGSLFKRARRVKKGSLVRAPLILPRICRSFEGA